MLSCRLIADMPDATDLFFALRHAFDKPPLDDAFSVRAIDGYDAAAADVSAASTFRRCVYAYFA